MHSEVLAHINVYVHLPYDCQNSCNKARYILSGCCVCVSLANPGFYMVNWLWLGKCYLAIGNKDKAKPWLEKVVGYDTQLEEELEVLSMCVPSPKYM